MKERILVVGNNARNVVQSAFKAGYEVYALTRFIDSDLVLFSKVAYPIEDEDYSWVKKRTDELSESLEAKVILTSGYEDLKVKGEVLGCDPGAVENITNKLKFYKKLERAGLPFPEILKEREGECILKPIRGGGGKDIKIFKDREPRSEVRSEVRSELEYEPEGKEGKKEYLIQRLIRGIPCSASLMVGRHTMVVALNEILAGWKNMNACGFKYSGNITPFIIRDDVKRKLVELAEETCDLFDLRGSVGVDFIIENSSMEPYILEINPRFQGSLDSIEWSTDLNLFSLHIKALNGKKIDELESVKIKRLAIRAIYFTDRKIEIRRDLTGNPFYTDVPMKDSIYEKGDPLVSILASGRSRNEIIDKAMNRRDLFLRLISDRHSVF